MKQQAGGEPEETFWHSSASVCGRFFRILSDEKIFQNKDFYLQHNRTQIHKFEGWFPSRCFSAPARVCARLNWQQILCCRWWEKCITYLRINLKSKLFGKQLCRRKDEKRDSRSAISITGEDALRELEGGKGFLSDVSASCAQLVTCTSWGN